MSSVTSNNNNNNNNKALFYQELFGNVINLLNNEKYFYSLMNHLMVLLRRSQYFGNSQDTRWESLDDWHMTKISHYGGYYTCKMVASLLMLIFESVISIFEKGFNSFGGGNYNIDKILKEFEEFMIKWLN